MTLSIEDLETLHLDDGSHPDPTAGHCLMEAVSMFAKEPFTDSPRCVSPYLRSFGIRLNDRATDERRQDLRRFIPLVVGTAGDGHDTARRWLAADHVVHISTPRWLDKAGLTEHAQALRALPPITNHATYNSARPVIVAARDAAYKARDKAYGGKSRWDYIRDAVKAELTKKPAADADAVAAAVAAAVADAAAAAAADAAAAAAAAAAADADADAAADAAADAVAVAVAAAAAAAAADADADAVAVAVAVADAAADAAAVAAAAADWSYGSKNYWTVREAVYAKVQAVYDERYADLLAESWTDALGLYERLILIGAQS